MPNFSSLARLEVPEKFVWWVVGGWGLQSHFRVKPNRCVRLGWGFDNNNNHKTTLKGQDTLRINLVRATCHHFVHNMYKTVISFNKWPKFMGF